MPHQTNATELPQSIANDPRYAVLERIGVTVQPDTDQPGRWVWVAPTAGSDASAETAAAAFDDAWRQAAGDAMAAANLSDEQWDALGAAEQGQYILDAHEIEDDEDDEDQREITVFGVDEPLPREQLAVMMGATGRIWALVAIDLSDLLSCGLEGLNDNLSRAVAGDEAALTDITHMVVDAGTFERVRLGDQAVILRVSAVWTDPEGGDADADEEDAEADTEAEQDA